MSSMNYNDTLDKLDKAYPFSKKATKQQIIYNHCSRFSSFSDISLWVIWIQFNLVDFQGYIMFQYGVKQSIYAPVFFMLEKYMLVKRCYHLFTLNTHKKALKSY